MVLDYDKLTQLTQNDPEKQKQFIQGLRAMDSTLDFSKFGDLDDLAIYKKIEAEQPQIYLKNLDKSRQSAMDKAYYNSENPLNYVARKILPEALLTQKQKEQNERDTTTEQEFYKAARYNIPYQDLHPQIQKTYSQKDYNKELKNQELATKTIQELTQEDKEFIKSETGLLDSFFNDDDENIKKYMEANHAKEVVTPQTKKALDYLKNIHASHDIMSQAAGLVGLKDEKLIKDYMDSLETIMQNLGFAGVGTDEKGEIYVFDQKGRAYQVKSGFVESLATGLAGNAGSIAGSILGSSLGYKFAQGLGTAGRVVGAAPSPYTKAAGYSLTTIGTILGGAVGSATGSLSDTILTNAYLNRENTAPEMIRHAISEGTLSMVADSAVMSLIKLWGKAKQIKSQALKQSFKQVADTAIEYTPLLGFAKRAKDGNKAAAQKLIDHAIPQEAQADLKALESIFGAEVQIGATKTSQAQSALNSLESKLGSDSYIVKGAKSLYDTFAFTSQKQAQKDFIRAIRADESGNLSAFLSEAANASPVIQKNLLEILNQTSQKLAHQLGRFDLPPSTIKDVFDNFEKGTKQSYTDAIEQILLKVYDESYTTTLAKDAPNIPSNLSPQEAARFNTDSLEAFKAKMEKSGVMLEDSAKFLRFVESTIYNPKGVTFEALNNAQKTLNSYYKQATDPNFRNFVKDAVNGFIKRDIQAGIEKIFAQNAPLYNDARTLFDTALSDYATMKETLKLADSLKIRDRRRSYDQVAQSLSRFFLGQGDNIPNFEALLGGLQKELREQVELKLLQDMLELSFVKLNEIKVLDSSEFFKRLDPLKGYFASTSAKDFIKIAQDFHTLFRNDASIARSLSPATTEKIGTSIATTLEGAVKFQVIKALFANIIRLMPHIPFAKGLNEKVQGSALRYQLKKALDSSLSVGEFKLELQARSLKADFNNATREQIARILNETDTTAIDSALGKHSADLGDSRAVITDKVTPTPESPKNHESPTATPRILEREAEQTPKVDSSAEHFGQNFSEFKGQGAKAVEKVLQERSGQVQGAYHRDDLGEIDVVWGEVQGSGKEAKGWGLAKIIEKHLNAGDFKAFGEGEAGLINAINEIIDKGKLIKDGDRATLRYVKDGEIFKLGLKGNWHGEPTQNKWIITTYKDEREMAKTIDSSDFTKGETLPFNSSGNSTTLSPLEQAQAQKQAKQEAQEAAQQAQRQADQATAQAIKDKNDQIQHLKDSRAGKSEMEREVKIGEPIAMKRTEQPPTSIATDDNNIYQLDFVIVKAHDVKPNFNADGLQPRTQKEHKTIESIAQNFKPEMVLGRGGYKDLPIIAKDGQVITGNHRVQGFKDFTQESRAAYEKAIKERFNIELASDELLLRTPSDDLSVKELLSIAYNSNKEDIKNLGDQIYSVLGRYAPNFAKLPRQLESSSVQELKSKIARILDNSPYPNENDANLALLANTIKADKNANITEILNAFSKLDKEDADKTLSTFTDTAGLWHILSNNAVEYGLKQLDLRPYLLGAMYKSATSQHTTRAANFKELNEQIKHILDTTDSSGSNAMLVMMPNTYDNLIADLLGASLARFMRLENPSANLYEALKGANSGIREQLAPRLDFETGFTTGKNIEQADIFDFIEYMIRQGEGGKEVNEAVELLPKLREKYNAFKGSTTPPSTPTPPTPPKPTLESQAGKEASTEATEVIHKEAQATPSTPTPAETPAQKVDSSVESTTKDTPTPPTQKRLFDEVDSSETPPSKINFTYTTGEAKGIAELRKDLKQALEPYKSTPITNKETGLQGVVTIDEINKIASKKAVDKSVANGFSRDEHFTAAQDLKNLFENATKAQSHNDYKQRENIAQVHRFVKDLYINDKQAQAKITLFEKIQGKNKIYTLELESLNKPDPLSASVPNTESAAKAQSVATARPETTTIAKTDGEIIPQKQISNIKKQLVELKQSKSAYKKYLKSLERNMKDVELEERTYLRGEERIKVFERKRLIQSSIDEHTQGLNAVLKKMIELHKQLPENVRYTKEVLDDLTKIEAILKGNDYSLEQALRLSKITQRLQEKAIIENESFLNKVYKLDDFAKGAKSLQGTSYTYNTDESIKRYFKTIAEMIDSIPAFKKISANPKIPKVDSSESNHYAQREQTKAILEPLINKPITNQNDGRVAQISRKNIAKMTSDKAVAKSVANGFTPQEHFKAVQEVDKLYQRAMFKETTDDKNGENYLKIHRYIAETDNTQAKITLKESEEHGSKIYTLELEELQAPKIQVHSQDIGEQVSKSRKPEPMHPDTPLENASVDSTTKTFNQADIKLEALSDFSKFARLAGFGDLSEQELERAHKHILENLQRIEC